jgi:hypothetical protein
MLALNFKGGGGGILHILKVLSLVQAKVSICKQKNPHITLIRDCTQNPFNESGFFTAALLTLFQHMMYVRICQVCKKE